MEDENSLVPALVAVFLGLGGALAAVAVVLSVDHMARSEG